MSQCVAVLNAGSSSIKFALYQGDATALLFRGQIEKIGVAPSLKVRDADGKELDARNWPAEGFDHHAATNVILETAIRLLDGEKVVGVGHRVVHGGTRYAPDPGR
jgi:acetate kinase